MGEDRLQRVQRIFEEGLRRDASSRSTYLEAACGHDAELRGEVEGLLRHHAAAAEGFMERAPRTMDADRVEATTREVALDDSPPETVGPYKVLETLGEGAFGVVYLVEQTYPIRRRAALKVIKAGMDSRQVIARFEAERQSLALMDHPNVAKVFEAGTTEKGRPYFLMEHVPGVPITEHCDRQRLTIEERLRLFMSVCDAIQHAHQKGIIHRDIKPTNILVTARDGGGLAKVIDFGVAKALHQPLTERSVFTEQGQLIGTPEYMSPEQAEMTAQDIDTRSDIYSLGVLLYELITGQRPFSSETMRRASIAEIQRIIREDDPPKPSTRLSRLGTEAGAAPGARRADAAALARRVRGDLDWIVMKALEKNRSRRYATAGALAEDVQRHLEDQPVRAGPPSVSYRAAKFCRRHRAAVTTAAAVAVALLLGIAGTASGWRRATIERAEAEQRFDQVLDISQTLLGDFMESIEGLDGTLPAREILATKALEHLDRLAAEGRDDPETMRSLASAYEKVGDLKGSTNNPSFGYTGVGLRSFEKALAIREALARARPDDDEAQKALAQVHRKIGDAQRVTGDLPGAWASYGRAIDIQEARLAARPDDDVRRRGLAVELAKVARMMEQTGQASRALDLYERSLALRRQIAADRPDDPQARKDLSVVLHRIGHRLLDAGRAAEGLASYEEALRLRIGLVEGEPDNRKWQRDLANSRILMAEALLELERPGDALEHAQAALPFLEQQARDNPHDRQAAFALAYALEIAGRTQDMLGDAAAAERRFEELRATIQPLMAATPDQPLRELAALSHAHIADLRAARGDLAGAFDSATRRLMIVEALAAESPGDLDVRAAHLRALTQVGRIEVDLGRADPARERLEAAAAGFTALRDEQPESRELREGHARALHQLARAVERLGDAPRALDLAVEAVDTAPRPSAEMLRDLARFQFENGDRAAALATVRRALERLRDRSDQRAAELRRALEQDERRYRE